MITSQFNNMASSSNYFKVFFSLAKLRYWCKFHVNIITGSGVMTIYYLKGLSRSLEIGYIPVLVLPNTQRLGLVKDTKLSFCGGRGREGLVLKYVFLFDFRLSLIQEQIKKTIILSQEVHQKRIASLCRFCRGKIKTSQGY